jgi:hypothetical protein
MENSAEKQRCITVDGINHLYIHVPKTGGTSIETYFVKKYNLPWPALTSNTNYDPTISKSSKQHYTLSLLLKHAPRFGIVEDNALRIFGSVRNPYTRTISDLYFNKLITPTTTAEETENVLVSYFNAYRADHEAYDNHVKPQYLFFVNEDGVMDPRVNIIRQESLQADMHSLGFTDFSEHTHRSPICVNYYDQLTPNSICMINDVYKEDFTRFGYEMITGAKT